MPKDNLKPCPFCLSDFVSVETLLGLAYVRCGECGAHGPSFVMKHKHDGRWATDVACDAWNKPIRDTKETDGTR